MNDGSPNYLTVILSVVLIWMVLGIWAAMESAREAAVESLREQIKAVRAEAENKITELTRRINELQAIECAEQGK